MSDLLLQTKLFKPALRSSLITRTHLIDQLNAGLGIGTEGFTARLTLVCAPAGFGKTTLVTAWLDQFASRDAQSSSGLIAWLSLDYNDNDPIRFLAYLTAALQTAVPQLGETAEHYLQSPQPPTAETILTLLINDITRHNQPLILVLDDYHVVAATAVHQAVVFLLEHLPPQLHLLITTRSDPALPLSRLRARDQIVEIRANDLRFAFDEIHLFFNQVMGLTLSHKEMAALEQRTEGWIAGLQLAALSLKGRTDQAERIAAFTGSHRFIIDYLTEEVLSHQPDSVRNFLLSTSILERVCGSLGSALTQTTRGQETLEYLEQSNLFLIPLDDERCWYRYHHLFAEVLRQRLQQEQPARLPELHRRASEWFEASSFIAEAVQHALAASDIIRAASLIERERWTLQGRGEINALHKLLNELPAETVRARPRLCLVYAWIFSLLEQVEAIEPYLQNAEKALASARPPEPPKESNAIRGEIATLRAEIALSQSEIPRAIEWCQEALKLLPVDNPLLRGVATLFLGHAQRRGGQMVEAERVYVEASSLGLQTDNLLLALHALSNLSIVQMALGRLEDAAETSQRILQITTARQRQNWPVTGLAYQGLGKLYYEWNNLDTAANYLRLGIECGQRGGLIGLEFNSRDTLTFTLQAQHDPGGVDEMLQEIAAMTKQHHHPVYAAVAAAQEARLRLIQGRLDLAGYWAETCDLHIDDAVQSYSHEGEYLTLARVVIAQGHAEKVIDLLRRLHLTAESDQRTGSLIEILILCALAWQDTGDLTNAVSAIEQALTLAEPEGYVRTFVDEGEPMAKLLRQVRQRGLFPHYVDKLLATVAAKESKPWGVDLLPEPLSEREMEVLQLVAAGASNKEIADQLFIAVTTVKKHISNMLVKLDTPNRTQAAARARELGLLP